MVFGEKAGPLSFYRTVKQPATSFLKVALSRNVIRMDMVVFIALWLWLPLGNVGPSKGKTSFRGHLFNREPCYLCRFGEASIQQGPLGKLGEPQHSSKCPHKVSEE